MNNVPSKAEMSRIMSSSAAVLSTTDKEVSKKRCNRPGVAQDFERVTFNWVCEQQSRRVFLNSDMILHKAQSLMKLYSERGSAEKRIGLKFSLGWLEDFKRRWKRCFFCFYGDSGDREGTPVAIALPKLQKRF